VNELLTVTNSDNMIPVLLIIAHNKKDRGAEFESLVRMMIPENGIYAKHLKTFKKDMFFCRNQQEQGILVTGEKRGKLKLFWKIYEFHKVSMNLLLGLKSQELIIEYLRKVPIV
jgi:hypothetical protein